MPLKFKNIFIATLHLLLIGNSYAQLPKTKIGLLLADIHIERWSKDRDFFISKSGELNYTTMIGDAMSDQEIQNQQADSMIKAGAKILVVVPVDAYKAYALVENAHKYGVRVVSYDRLIMNCDLDAFVSFDAELIGIAMAMYSTKNIKNGTIAYIGGPGSDMNSFGIRKGLIEILTPSFEDGSLVMVCDTFTKKWSSTESKNILNNFLVNHKCPDIIFTANDELASGVIEVLDQKGLSGKVLVTGQDAELRACRNIITGKQTLTVYKPIRILAERAVYLASGLLGDMPFLTLTEVYNGKTKVPSLILGPTPVDKMNLSETVIKEGYHTENEVYGDKK